MAHAVPCSRPRRSGAHHTMRAYAPTTRLPRWILLLAFLYGGAVAAPLAQERVLENKSVQIGADEEHAQDGSDRQTDGFGTRLHQLFSSSETDVTHWDTIRRYLSTTDETGSLDDPLFGSVAAWRLILASCLALIVTSLAVAAGIGGGGLLVPMLAVVLSVGTKKAIPISQATIFGVSLGNTLYIVTLKHPKANRPLIDYEAISVLLPCELAGVIVGVLLNRILPSVIIIIILAMILVFAAYTTLMKAARMWKAETGVKATEKATVEASSTTQSSLDGSKQPGQPVDENAMNDESTSSAVHTSDKENKPSDIVGISVPRQPMELERPVLGSSDQSRTQDAAAIAVHATGHEEELRRCEKEEAVQYPKLKLISLWLMTILLIVYSLLMSGTLVSSFDECSPAYWPVFWLPVVIYFVWVAYYTRAAVLRYQHKLAIGFNFISGDATWTRRNVWLLIPTATGAGVSAGLLGLGGGMVLGPLLVALNFQPQVSSANNGFMMFFTAVAGLAQYLALDLLGWEYALWFAVVGAIGGQTGQRVVQKLVRRTGRPSIIVWILGFIIAAAVIATATYGTVNVVRDRDDGVNVWALDTSYYEC
eukprot:866232-Pleurochrysis_carterae.AAC.3